MIRSISHPHVVAFLGIYTSPDSSRYIVTEYLTKGSLLNLVQKSTDILSILDLLGMARHAAAGMKYLEFRRIVHRDIALRNLLVTLHEEENKYLVKVGDFGLARSTEKGIYASTQKSIPIRWTAPEVTIF